MVLFCAFIRPNSSVLWPPCVCFCILAGAAFTPCLSRMTYVVKELVNCVLELRQLPMWDNLLHCFLVLSGRGRVLRCVVAAP